MGSSWVEAALPYGAYVRSKLGLGSAWIITRAVCKAPLTSVSVRAVHLPRLPLRGTGGIAGIPVNARLRCGPKVYAEAWL